MKEIYLDITHKNIEAKLKKGAEEVVTEEGLSVDSFIEKNKEALQDISKTNTPLFNALNGVLEVRLNCAIITFGPLGTNLLWYHLVDASKTPFNHRLWQPQIIYRHMSEEDAYLR